MSALFRRGDLVFLASGGVARIVDFAARDPLGKPGPWDPHAGPPVFYVVHGESVTACVPIDRASEALRPLVSPEVARQMLDALRRAEPEPPVSTESLLDRGKRAVHDGLPLEAAKVLRELFALPAPIPEALGTGLLFLSGLVLGEIAAVLQQPRRALEEELAERFPAVAELHARDRERIRFRHEG